MGFISHFMVHIGLSLTKSVYVISRGMGVVVNEARYVGSMQSSIHAICFLLQLSSVNISGCKEM